MKKILNQWALPCAVCFGKTDNADIGKAFNWGIGIMLAFTFLLIGGFFVAMYRLEKLHSTRSGGE